MALPAASELGTIRSGDGWSYRITPEDLLWLARSVTYEGGDPVATAWTYAQRMVARGRSITLADMVLHHSQPVNPDWASLDAPGCVRQPERCRPRQRADGTFTRDPLIIRAEARSRTWESMPIAPMLVRWARAEVGNNAPRSTDFADAEVSAGFIHRYPQTRIVKQAGRDCPVGNCNWYLSESAASSPRPSNLWPSNFVKIEYAGRSIGTAASGLGLLGFGVVALVAWRAAASVKWLGKR